jgi:group II intron reverse transcriptase/maturase
MRELQTIADFAAAEDQEIAKLLQELKGKDYRPRAVRRVTSPKPGGGERLLGIPAVRDRVVQRALLTILEPVFEPHFHPSSYAYRPGRGCHDAIAKVAFFARDHDLEWVVDLDLSKCFDTLDHNLIIDCFRKRVADGSVLQLVRNFLESGVMIDGTWHESETGMAHAAVSNKALKTLGLYWLETVETGILPQPMLR